MRMLISGVADPQGKKLAEEFSALGHITFCMDQKNTEDRFPNFIKLNMNNFEALLLALKLANPEEIHHIVDSSYLKNIHLLLAATRVRKIVFYFKEASKFLDDIAKLCSTEIGYEYINKIY